MSSVNGFKMAVQLLLVVLASMWIAISAQQSPFSLQAAVDALHRREGQLATRDNYALPPRYNLPQESDYWDDDSSPPPAHVNRMKLNRIRAKYLSGEKDNEHVLMGYDKNLNDDNYLSDEKKRSFFREREEKYDSPYQTVFRERELSPLSRSELAEQFLKEIEQERELEREEKYKDTLRHLWGKYQQQENEIEDDLFDEEKRRHPMASDIGPYYVGPPMERKRSYPVLPWLPASRKKRFPITKRSPPAIRENDRLTETDKNVVKDLQEIFGQNIDDKKKRSAGDENLNKEQSSVSSPKNNNSLEEHPSDHGQHSNHHNYHTDHNGSHEESDSDEHDQDHERKYGAEHDHEEDEEDFDDDEDEDRKKKRDTSLKKQLNKEELLAGQPLPADPSISRKKKSVEWSKYFGIDRKKKDDAWYMGVNSNAIEKRSAVEMGSEEKENSQNLDSDKLKNMDHKLKMIEDLIIDETIKYTGAHEGISDANEIRQLKDHVISRLATAYSLEKMRRALGKLRQSVEDDNHLLKNKIEPNDDAAKEKDKRVAVKKEKVNYQENHSSLESTGPEKPQDVRSNNIDNNSGEDNNKKKRNNLQRYPGAENDLGEFEDEMNFGHREPLAQKYFEGRNYGSRRCPILDNMEERCRSVNVLSGDIHQELVPICSIHQLCYLCGTSQVACDLQFLSDTDSFCGHNSDCQSAAKSTLMILRGAPGPQVGPSECLKNSCLYRVMTEIGL